MALPLKPLQVVFSMLFSILVLVSACGPKTPVTLSSRTVPDDRTPADVEVLSNEELARRQEWKIVEDAIRKNPRDPEGYYTAGMLSLKTGQWEGARKLFEKSLSLNPDYAEAMYQLAYSWEQAGEVYQLGSGVTILPYQRDEAIKRYRKATKINGNYSNAYYRLTLLALLKSDFKLALWGTTELARIEPDAERTINLTRQVYKEINKNKK